MIHAVLFDLDGTLLASDLDSQLSAYMKSLKAYMQNAMPEIAPALPHVLMQSIEGLVDDVGKTKTVAEKFWRDFCEKVQVGRAQLEPVFEVFYETVYGQIGSLYTPVAQMQQAVAYCKGRGCKLAVATNCLYPRVAVDWRLRWAGLNPADFDVITDYQSMHVTKPHLAYYQEVAALLGVEEAACCMVGNHGVEDMAAAKLQMQTFLLTDFALDEACYDGPKGSYADLLNWLKATL